MLQYASSDWVHNQSLSVSLLLIWQVYDGVLNSTEEAADLDDDDLTDLEALLDQDDDTCMPPTM